MGKGSAVLNNRVVSLYLFGARAFGTSFVIPLNEQFVQL